MPQVHPAVRNDNSAAALTLDANGNLNVNVAAGGGAGGTSSNFGAAFPGTGTAAGAKDASGNMAALNLDPSGYLEVNVKAGSGSGLSVTDEAAYTAGSSQFIPTGGVYNDAIAALTSGETGADRSTPNRAKHVNLRNNSGTEIGTLANAVRVDPVGTTAQPVSQSGSWTAQSVPGTANGWTPNSQTALSATPVAIKASAGLFGGYMFFNPNSATVYIQVFNLASGGVTVGTTAPAFVIPLPAGAAANVEFSLGISLGLAISAAATTTPTGSTAPASALTGFFLFN